MINQGNKLYHILLNEEVPMPTVSKSNIGMVFWFFNIICCSAWRRWRALVFLTCCTSVFSTFDSCIYVNSMEMYHMKCEFITLWLMYLLILMCLLILSSFFIGFLFFLTVIPDWDISPPYFAKPFLNTTLSNLTPT